MVQQLQRFSDAAGAIRFVYDSYNRAKQHVTATAGPDRAIRHPEWTDRLLTRLGRPDTAACNIAVTGSKGKGSHAILVAAMLQRAGLKVGLFTGPHLVDFLERMRVNGQAICEEQFVHYIEQVASACAGFALPPDQYFGPVGLLAAAAALWFRDEGTDVNIYELGRGALHDDVNQVVHTGALITPVFMEHVHELGPTLADIAREKAGVITRHTRWVISHPQTAVVEQALSERTGGTVDLQFVTASAASVQTDPQAKAYVRLSYPEGDYDLLLPHADGFIVPNAAVAFAAARRAWQEIRPGWSLPAEIDLSCLRLPGRLQILMQRPLIVLDGTIHRTSAEQVRSWLEAQKGRLFQGEVGAVLSMPADKDGHGVIGALAGCVNWWILTRCSNPHVVYDEKLAAKYGCGRDVTEITDVARALDIARARLRDTDALLLLGTQSFVRDVLVHFGQDTLSIWR